MAHGQFSHLEIPADDPARAKRFYAELFGWQFSEMDGFPDYFLFSIGKLESAGGAVGKRNESTGDKLRLYIEADSIDPAAGQGSRPGRHGQDAADRRFRGRAGMPSSTTAKATRSACSRVCPTIRRCS